MVERDADATNRESVRVYEVPESAWETWRELRLEALADSPEAFGDTIEAARTRVEADWRAWWQGQPGAGPRFMAEVDGGPAGMCAICLPEDHEHEPLLINMWTSPKARGRGVGRAMLDACVTWCEQAGHARFHLGVVEDNLPARGLYEGYGFVFDGRDEPLHSDPSKLVLWMFKPVTGITAG